MAYAYQKERCTERERHSVRLLAASVFHITAALTIKQKPPCGSCSHYVYCSPIAVPREPSGNHAERIPDNENTIISAADDILTHNIKCKYRDGDVGGALLV